MNPDIENELRPQLSHDEKLLWTGRPKTGIRFRPMDFYLIPFSIIWLSFAVFWESIALRSGVIFMAVFGLAFVCIGLVFSIGRFFIDAQKRKNTTYGITDSRVIIKSGLFARELKSLPLRNLSDLSYKEKADGSGSISLGPAITSPFGMRRRGFASWSSDQASPSLEFIDEVATVYNLLLAQQRKN